MLAADLTTWTNRTVFYSSEWWVVILWEKQNSLKNSAKRVLLCVDHETTKEQLASDDEDWTG